MNIMDELKRINEEKESIEKQYERAKLIAQRAKEKEKAQAGKRARFLAEKLFHFDIEPEDLPFVVGAIHIIRSENRTEEAIQSGKYLLNNNG